MGRDGQRCDKKDKYERIKYLSTKDLCVNNLRAQNAAIETLQANNVISKSIQVDNLDAVNGKVSNLQSDNIVATHIQVQDLESTNINTKSIVTKDITAKGKIFFNDQYFRIEVGDDKQFKNIQDAISVLQNKLILGQIDIKIDPGTYDGFNVVPLNNLSDYQLNILGDERIIAGSTFVNNSDEKYYTFIFTDDGENTNVQIIDNTTTKGVNLVELGLVVGDKVIFYNGDPFVVNKADRFLEGSIVTANDVSFTVNVSVNFTSKNSTVTFLPNVFIKATITSTKFPDIIPFPNIYNIQLTNTARLVGMTLLEPETFSAMPSISNDSPNSVFDSIVVIGKTWQQVTINGVVYTGFSNPGAYADLFTENETTFLNFIVLGTGYNPQNDKIGPISLNSSKSITMFETYIINCVENLTGLGIIYFNNTRCTLTDFALLGVEAAIGLFLTNSQMYDSRNFIIADCFESILVEINSYLDLRDSIFINYALGIECQGLSKVILENVNMDGSGQDFCIKDLSQILRDKIVVIAPSC
jgi:hypothetical protein